MLYGDGRCRELRQNASALLERIEASGVTIEITNHGHPVARLVPIPTQEQQSRAQLIDAGVLRPGRGDLLDIADAHDERCALDSCSIGRRPRRPVSLYFETSALAKLIIAEEESEALRDWVSARRGIARITNDLALWSCSDLLLV